VYAKLMKEWDNIGVWKTDVLNNTASSNRDDYRIGRVAAEQHHTQTWTDLCSCNPLHGMAVVTVFIKFFRAGKIGKMVETYPVLPAFP
jgi:hypothetical protein